MASEELYLIARALIGPDVRRDGYGNIYSGHTRVTEESLRQWLRSGMPR